MNIADIAVFNKVAETMSFSRAGELLGMTRSAVSKRIARLETDLGVILFNRSPRSISLTEAGQKFYDHTVSIDHTINQAAQAIQDSDQRPSGVLSFSLSTNLAVTLMPPLLEEFQREWPDLKIDLHTSEHFVDIIGEGFDVVIRIAMKLGDSSLVSRKLATTPQILVAAPAYLEEYGVPRHVSDLKDHKCVTLLKREVVWRFINGEGRVEVPVNMASTTNSDLLLFQLVRLGGGIVRCPKIQVERELRSGELVTVLDDFKSPDEYGVFALYPYRNPPAKVKVFLDFIEAQLARLQGLEG